jgi:two-component system response regulator
MNTGGGKATILLVEDNPGDVELLKLALEQAGVDYQIHLLEDGGTALAHVRARNASPVDLAVVDLNLPQNDGMEILAAMRESAVFAHVPVVVFTSSVSPRDRARIEGFQIERYLPKPSDLEQYMRVGSTLKEILNNRRARESSNSL